MEDEQRYNIDGRINRWKMKWDTSNYIEGKSMEDEKRYK